MAVLKPLPRLDLSDSMDGGQSRVVFHPSDSRLLVKLFTEQNGAQKPRRGQEAAHLVDLASFADGLRPSAAIAINEKFSWPVELYGDPSGHPDIDEIHGIGIPVAAPEFWVEYRQVLHGFPDEWLRKPQDLAFILYRWFEKAQNQDAPWRTLSLEDRVELALDCLQTMRILWRLGYRYGDYSAKNFLFALTPFPRIFVIDAETCLKPGSAAPMTADWQVGQHLGFTIEEDRAKCALLSWRLVFADMTFVNQDPQDLLDDRVQAAFWSLSRSGTEDAVDELIAALRTYRSPENERKRLEWARNTGYASLVLQWAPSEPTPDQQILLEDARLQVAREEAVLAQPPHLHRFLLSQKQPIPGFEFDIVVDQSLPIGSREEIRSLALEGAHDAVAGMALDLDPPRSHVLERSIQMALAWPGIPDVRVSPRAPDAGVRFEWGWPGAAYVNAARICVHGRDGRVFSEQIVERRSALASGRLPAGSFLDWAEMMSVTYALITPSGECYIALSGKEIPLTRPASAGRAPSPRPPMQTEADMTFRPRSETLIAPRPAPMPDVLAPPAMAPRLYDQASVRTVSHPPRSSPHTADPRSGRAPSGRNPVSRFLGHSLRRWFGRP
jgi:hypothetical protein